MSETQLLSEHSSLNEQEAQRILSISRLKPDDFPVGEIINERYSISSFLGQGGFAKVIAATDEASGRRVAIKACTAKNGREVAILRNEIVSLRVLNHPNIVQAFDFYQNERMCCIVMELVEGGELLDRLKPRTRSYTERTVQEVARTLLSAVRYMHDQNVIHRDLKPENLIMVSAIGDSNLKIVDFGFAAINVTGINLHGRCGTAPYMAPEMLQEQMYGKPVDMWAVGVIMYLMLFGYFPFTARTRSKLNENIISGKLKFPAESLVSEEARLFVQALLNTNPLQRLTARQALGHAWFSHSAADIDLFETQRLLRRFQMKAKLRKHLLAILAYVFIRTKKRKPVVNNDYRYFKLILYSLILFYILPLFIQFLLVRNVNIK